MTNYQKLTQMNQEDMAAFLRLVISDGHHYFSDEICNKCTEECKSETEGCPFGKKDVEHWLSMEVTE